MTRQSKNFIPTNENPPFLNYLRKNKDRFCIFLYRTWIFDCSIEPLSIAWEFIMSVFITCIK